jgi:hypothetical protein
MKAYRKHQNHSGFGLIMLGTPSDLGEGALPRSARPGECVHRSAPAKGTIIFDLLLLIGILSFVLKGIN